MTVKVEGCTVIGRMPVSVQRDFRARFRVTSNTFKNCFYHGLQPSCVEGTESAKSECSTSFKHESSVDKSTVVSDE